MLELISNLKHTNIAIFVLTATIFAITALIVNLEKIAYAQVNLTAVVDTEGFIKILKAKHPTLAALA